MSKNWEWFISSDPVRPNDKAEESTVISEGFKNYSQYMKVLSMLAISVTAELHSKVTLSNDKKSKHEAVKYAHNHIWINSLKK